MQYNTGLNVFVIIKEQARLELEREKATDAEINKLKSVYGEKEEVVQETSGHLAAQGVYFRYYKFSLISIYIIYIN